MFKYTNDIHAKRLIDILEEEDTCAYCPATDNYNGHRRAGEIWSEDSDPCRICQEFVGMKIEFIYFIGSEDYGKARAKCPCKNLGKEEAVKRTWLALEERGYV